MADTAIEITAGTGTNVDTRTEATNGNHRQVVVLGDPATNAGVAPVDATAGLKVDLGADNDISGTVTANLSATDNAVLDQIELNTDPLLVVGGGTEATAIRVTVANNSTGVLSVDDNGGALTVDGTVTADLGATDNAVLDTIAASAAAIETAVEGTLTVTGGGGTEYTEDVATANPIVGTATMIERDDALSTVTPIEGDNIGLRGTAEGALWTQDFNSDGILADTTAIKTSLETAGGQLVNLGANNDVTVTGTVDLGATDNAVLDAIEVDTTTIAGAVSGTEMQVDVVAALPAGTNAIGKLAANTGVDIGDVDVTSIAAGDNNIGNVDLASAIPAGTNAIGKVIPPDYDVTSHTAKAVKYYTSAGAATDGIIWSPAAGKRWHVTTLFINISAAATVTLEDDLAAGDSAVMKMELAANSGVAIPFGDLYPLTSGEDAADLLITTSAGNVYVTCVGYEI